VSVGTLSPAAALERLVDGYERLVGGPNEDFETKLGDLTMFVIPGGRERTLDEFTGLFSASGFRLRDAIPAGGHFVIEGDPV
jgi:hypothetical protein